MFELTFDLEDIDPKIFYGVNNQYFNLIKSSFPTIKITGRDHFIFAMGNQEALDILKQKLDDIVNFISKNNSIGLKDVENILNIKDENEKQLIFDQDIIVKESMEKLLKPKPPILKSLLKRQRKRIWCLQLGRPGQERPIRVLP